MSSLSRPNIGHLCPYHVIQRATASILSEPTRALGHQLTRVPLPTNTHTHSGPESPEVEAIIIHRIVCGHWPFSLADVSFVLSNSSHSAPCPALPPCLPPSSRPRRLLRPICNPIPQHAPRYPPCLNPTLLQNHTSCLGRSCPPGA